MKKKYILGLVIGVVALGGIFVATYSLRSSQLDQYAQEVTKDYVDQIDDMSIEYLEVTYDGNTYTSMEEIEKIPAGTTVDCKVTLANGETVETNGYVTKGDVSHAEYNGGIVKITVKE